jgi:hypothetical protein
MKRLLFALMLLVLTFEPTTVDSLRILARDMGFRWSVEITQRKDIGGEYDYTTGTVVVRVTSGAEGIRMLLSHEIEHAKFYSLPQNNPIYGSIQNLQPYNYNGYAEYWWKNGTRFQAVNETLAEMAAFDSIGKLKNVPPDWLKVYYAFNNWYSYQGMK